MLKIVEIDFQLKLRQLFILKSHEKPGKFVDEKI